jgi:hypothetical protein
VSLHPLSGGAEPAPKTVDALRPLEAAFDLVHHRSRRMAG